MFAIAERATAFSRRHPVITDMGIVIAVFLLVNREFLLPAHYMPLHHFTDVFKLTKPVMTYTGQALVDGEIPLWNPCMYLGFPNHAMGCAGVFYPASFLYGLADFGRVFTWDIWLHVLMASVFSYVLGRGIGLRRPSAVALAVLVLCMEPFWPTLPISHITLGHIWAIHLLAWTPLVFLCLWRTLAKPDAFWALGLGLLLGVQILTGDLQLFMCQACVLGTFAAGELVGQLVARRDVRLVLRKAFVLAVAGAIALCIGALQWIPCREMIGQSVRAQGITLDYIRVWDMLPLVEVSLNYLRRGFTAVIPAALVFAGLVNPKERHRFAFCCMALFVFLLSVWPDTALAEIVRLVPFIGNARRPVRMFPAAWFLFYTLAAREFDRGFLRRDEDDSVSWKGSLLLFAAGSIGVLAFSSASAARNLVTVGMLSVLHMIVSYRRAVLPVGAVVAGLVVSALAIEAICVRRQFQGDSHAVEYGMHRDLRKLFEGSDSSQRVAVIDDAFHKGLSASGSVYRIRTIGGAHSLQLKDSTLWFSGITGLELVEYDSAGRLNSDRYDAYSYPEWLEPRAAPALDLLGVSTIVSKGDVGGWLEADATGDQERFRKLPFGKLVMYENKLAMPAAFAVHAVQPASSLDEVIAMLNDPDFDYRTVAPVPLDFDESTLGPAGQHESVSIREYGRNHVEIQVELSGGALIVLNDVMYPGWRVSVDDEEMRIVVAYGIFKSVPVPKGLHSIRFEFKPRSFPVGLTISLVGLGVTALLLALEFVRRGGRGGSL